MKAACASGTSTKTADLGEGTDTTRRARNLNVIGGGAISWQTNSTSSSRPLSTNTHTHSSMDDACPRLYTGPNMNHTTWHRTGRGLFKMDGQVVGVVRRHENENSLSSIQAKRDTDNTNRRNGAGLPPLTLGAERQPPPASWSPS